MSKKLIVNKGYTVEVTSWENDGDNYQTSKVTTQSKEYALSLLKLCRELFSSAHNGGGGIGNLCHGGRDGEEYEEVKAKYIEDNPEWKNEDVMDINYELMGSSEYYLSRVFESGTIYYSPKDVYLEEIN